MTLLPQLCHPGVWMSMWSLSVRASWLVCYRTTSLAMGKELGRESSNNASAFDETFHVLKFSALTSKVGYWCSPRVSKIRSLAVTPCREVGFSLEVKHVSALWVQRVATVGRLFLLACPHWSCPLSIFLQHPFGRGKLELQCRLSLSVLTQLVFFLPNLTTS